MLSGLLISQHLKNPKVNKPGFADGRREKIFLQLVIIQELNPKL
jgi:hypothetical protein